jgi:hypothetical protein
MIIYNPIKLFFISLLLGICILMLSGCKSEGILKNNSGFLIIPEAGELDVNYFELLNTGQILMAGKTTTLDADARQRGIDTGTYYLIDPNNLKYQKVSELTSKTGVLFGAVTTQDLGVILWISDFTDSGSSYLVKYDKNYKEVKRQRIRPKNSITTDSNLISVAKNNSMLGLSDGSFVILGFEGGALGEDNIIKFDKDLNIKWQFTWGMATSLTGMCESDNGSILVSGESGSRACVIKLNNAGILQFVKYTNYIEYSKFYDIENLGTGFLCTGYYYTGKNYTAMIWKYNAKGDTLKTRSFDVMEEEFEGWKLITTNDGGFICVFRKDILSTRKSVIAKLDSELKTVWEKSIGDFGEINTVVNVVELPNGNLVLGGYSSHNENKIYGIDGYVMVLDKDGNIF